MPSDVPRRIAVFGPSGSGKTTLSKQIGERLRLPVVELDALFHGLIMREPLVGDNRESWRMTFASRQSILLWGITNWKSHARKIAQTLNVISHEAPVIELRSAQEVEEFIGQLADEYQLSR